MKNSILDATLDKTSKKDKYLSRLIKFKWLHAAQSNPLLINRKPSPHEIEETGEVLLSNFLPHYFNIQKNIKLENSWESNFIPEEELTWIKDDHRQALWINSHGLKPFTAPTTELGKYIYPPIHLRGRSLSIAIIDHFATTHSNHAKDTISQIKQLSIHWQTRVEMDHIFKWFTASKSAEKINFFWEWAKKNSQTINDQQPKFNNHEELLIFFDQLSISENEKDFLVQKSRKIWNQKERRENQKEKKQCNFTLSEQAIKKLDTLKIKHRVSRSEIIELLINGEINK